jgi:hypothetical protein
METHPLIGMAMRIGEEIDESGMGAEFYWLTPENMISEGFYLHPGKVVAKEHFLPIGACAIGTGDPYFLDLKSGDDPRLVRILHQLAPANDAAPLPAEAVEQVAQHLSSFLKSCEML